MADPADDVIERFYGAFAQRDGEAMAACYATWAQFSDPVFPDLHGERVGAMWRMLTKQGKDLRLELLDHQCSEDSGRARWRATYTFSQTGRPVVNNVEASFQLSGGLIVEHRDRFDFYRWARQALGPAGWALGWTPLLRGQVQQRAAKSLDQFIAGAGGGAASAG